MNQFNHNTDSAVPLERQRLAQELLADIARTAITAEQCADQRLLIFANEHPVGTLEPGATIELELPATASLIIKLRPAPPHQDVLVSSFYLTEDDLASATSAWETWARVGSDYVHKLTIEPVQKQHVHIRVASQPAHATAFGQKLTRLGMWLSNLNFWDQVLTPQVLSFGVVCAVLMTALIDWQFSQVKRLRSYSNKNTSTASAQTEKLRAGFSAFYQGYENDRQRRNGWSDNAPEANAADISAQARLETIRVESNRYLARQSSPKTSFNDATNRPDINLVSRRIPPVTPFRKTISRSNTASHRATTANRD